MTVIRHNLVSQPGIAERGLPRGRVSTFHILNLIAPLPGPSVSNPQDSAQYQFSYQYQYQFR
jgi:hypothetical protein